MTNIELNDDQMSYKIIFSDDINNTRYCKDDKVLEETLMLHGNSPYKVIVLDQEQFKREVKISTDYIMNMAKQQLERS